jgi:hypothetical protein
MEDISQGQFFEVKPQVPARLVNGELPKYSDVILSPEQIKEAQEIWPDAKGKTPEAKLALQIRNMRMRILNQMRHQIILPDGRRAFGGAQDTRPKHKKRIDESLIEAADNRVQEIIDAAFSALDSKLSPEIRHKAAMNIAKEAREVRKQQVIEDEIARASGEDLTLMAAEILAERIQAGELSIEDIFKSGKKEKIIDADVIE